MKQFDSSYQPEKRRGKGRKTLLIEALYNSGLTPQEFMDNMVKLAETDPKIAAAIMDRIEPKPKGSIVEFTLNTKKAPSEQCAQVIKAMSKGQLSIDEGGAIISAIKETAKLADIEAVKKAAAELGESNPFKHLTIGDLYGE